MKTKTLKLNKEEEQIVKSYQELNIDREKVGSYFEDISKEIDFDDGIRVTIKLERL